MKIGTKIIRAAFTAGLAWFWFMAILAAVDALWHRFGLAHAGPDRRLQAWIWLGVALTLGVISFVHQSRGARRTVN